MMRTESYSEAVDSLKDGDAPVMAPKNDGAQAVLDEVVVWDSNGKATKEEAEAALPDDKVSYLSLFRYASRSCRLLIALAGILGIVQGASLPALLYLFGDSLNAFGTVDPAEEINALIPRFLVVGGIAGLSAFFSRWIFNDVSGRIVTTIRHEFMDSLLRQDMEWHDLNPAAALEIRLNANMPKIHTALSTKFALFFANFGTAVGGVGIAFYTSPKLAGVFFATMLPMFVVFGITAEVMQDIEGVKAKIYEGAGIVSEEVLSLVRVVMTFGTYDREQARYEKLVMKSADEGKGVGRKFGIGMGLPPALLNLQYAVAFYYGAILIKQANAGDSNLEAGGILTALFCMMMGTMMLAMTSEYVQTAGQAQAAAFSVYAVIDRESKIDGLSEEGDRPEDTRGEVSLDEVSFSYPSSPDQTILDKLSFSVSRGKTLALVGHSGCGKSTVINLLMRFYSPKGGKIELDNNKLEDYNVGWLRNHIGLVQQMPTLLPGSIEDNIRLGKSDATDEEIVEACRVANATEFIEAFPDKYKTEVGSLGGKLSGGQKQRIAIARTLISKPRILLLDEATSALDSKSEAKFLNLLEETKADRTTIVIAHRLATIRDADEIIALGQGKVIERGTHDELVAKQGFYFNMLNAQEKDDDEDEDASEGGAADAGDGKTDAVASEASANKTDDDDAEIEVDDATAKEVTNYVWKKNKPFLFTIIVASLAGLLGGVGYGATNVVLAMMIQKVLMNIFDEVSYTCADEAGYWLQKGQEEVANLGTNPTPMNETVFMDRLFVEIPGNDVNNTLTAQDGCQFFGCEFEAECWGCVPVTLDNSSVLAKHPLFVAAGSTDLFVAVRNCSASEEVNRYGNYPSDLYTLDADGNPIDSVFGKAWDMTPAGDSSLVAPLCYAFIVVFFVMFIGRYLQYSLEYVAGEKLVASLRSEFYGVFLRKGAGYHDRHLPSELSLALSVGADEAANFYAHAWPKNAQILGILGSGVGIAFYYCWRLGLVMLGGLPLLVVGGALETMAMLQNNNKVDPSLVEAQELSGTIISNMMIITSLGRAKEFGQRYTKSLEPSLAHMSKQAVIFGVYGMIFQLTVFGVFALAFWYGGRAMSKGTCEPMDAIAALLGIMFAGFQAGQDASLLPDKGKALRGMAQAYDLIMDTTDDSAVELTGNDVEISKGTVEFKDVHFQYPTRPEAEVLKGMTFTIEGGTTVAIVGASGGGKSTILGLLQRLYHPSSGQVCIDGIDLADAQRDSLRAQLAVVPQEPKLFNVSVKDNISYRPQEGVKDEEMDGYVATAADAAHAAGFVDGLEGKYEYVVGRFGSRLSGGQCQRVAIARSIYGPEESRKLLLLDEATSALDNESEELVQKALDKAQEGRTTVIVAHRLSTIKDADKIIVLEEGAVAEEGTFSELTAKKGVFWSLYESAL